jgi:hypothetical protein
MRGEELLHVLVAAPESPLGGNRASVGEPGAGRRNLTAFRMLRFRGVIVHGNVRGCRPQWRLREQSVDM